MTIENEAQLEKLRTVGNLVARTLEAMGKALEPGMTTKELDDLGRALLEKEGARSAPEVTYNFPGATCISVGPDCAHGIPDDTVIKAGDLINIDVSAELDGFFGDTGASFAVPPISKRIERLCRDGRRAMWSGIRAVRPGAKLNEVVETANGAKILGKANLPGRIAADASALYARNLFAFAGLFLDKEGKFAPDYEDEILKAALVTKGGAVVHPSLGA